MWSSPELTQVYNLEWYIKTTFFERNSKLLKWNLFLSIMWEQSAPRPRHAVFPQLLLQSFRRLCPTPIPYCLSFLSLLITAQFGVFFFFISLLVHVKGLWVYFIPDVFPQPAYLKKSRIIFEHNFGASKQNKYPNCLWVSKLQVLPWWREVQKTEAKKAVSEASEADPVGWPIIPFFLFHFVGIVMD